MNDNEGLDRYDLEYDSELHLTAPRTRRTRPVPVVTEPQDVVTEGEEAFPMTYQPARFEAGWLRSSLQSFYQQEVIRDVLTHVKGGKEASVYCCQAHPITGLDLIAAKVYRPRQFRNLRNDRMYREGRAILTADGRAAKKTDHRLMRAVGKKTEFGMQVQHTSWLMYEYTTMERLFRAGASVPQPVAAGDNAILMSFQGDRQRAAPTLNEVRLEPAEAETLFREAIRNIELLLQHGLIHGDLSAYNILYWDGKITVIDFPQVVDCHSNSQAHFILQRDITRVCEYFAQQGVTSDPAALLKTLWNRHVPNEDTTPDLL